MSRTTTIILAAFVFAWPMSTRLSNAAEVPATPKLPVVEARSVQLALKYLAANQEPDGHWDCKKGGGGNTDLAATGLSLLAFLDAGYTPASGEHRTVVARALQWILAQKSDKGCLGKHGYENGIALLALAKTYYLDPQPELKSALTQCSAYAASTQSSGGGWDYTPSTAESTRNDVCVTSWYLRGLIYASAAGIDVLESALARTQTMLSAATDANGVCAYTITGNENKPFDTNPRNGSIAMTAVSLLLQQTMSQPRSNPVLIACADRIVTKLPNSENASMYQWYYCTQALALMGADNPQWMQYRWYVKTALEDMQNAGGLQPPAPDAIGHPKDSFRGALGNIGQTAMAVQILCACYRCPPGSIERLPGVPLIRVRAEVKKPPSGKTDNPLEF